MRRLGTLLIMLAIAGSAVGQNMNYLPSKVGSNQILTYTQFALSYNEKHEQPDWVAYELTGEEAATDRDRCNCFDADAAVTTGSASLEDYKGSGFDRGHMSPAADNNMSVQANKESFLLSNMSPQLSAFNSGIWADIEKWVRIQAEEYDTVWVATGPLFANNMGSIGPNEVTVPGYYYKVVLRRKAGKYYAIGFLLPHFYAIEDLRTYIVSVNVIESLTRIDFFSGLPDKLEENVERNVSASHWRF